MEGSKVMKKGLKKQQENSKDNGKRKKN